MSNPLVTVIIPVYNVEEFLPQCLNSIVEQTYNNIEIIAIDDGSTDNSLEILRRYELDYSNIKIISRKNSGPSNTRNAGIDEAKGKYIYFLDSDDYILPNLFEKLIQLMEEKNLDLIRFGVEPFVDGIEFELDTKQYDFRENFEKGKVYGKNELLAVNLNAFSAIVYAYIIKRELLTKNRIKFKPGILHEDELFTLEVFLNAHLAMYEENFYYKRRYRENSIMTSQDSQKIRKSFDSYCILIEEMNKLLEKYSDILEVTLIKKRILSVYIGLIYKKIDKKYKKRKLSEIKGVNKIDHLYYTLKYNVKSLLR
ncbi:glycosyltransferase [Priestia megaterium]|uniref:glycosyltransferase n=1 Tax=Priestia megaterium TaxID=1404 RepID=UPI0024699987|nr:glycosyltransferase [Priestia megaterium]